MSAPNYDLAPTTFNGLLASATGRKQALGHVPYHEAVLVTVEAELDLLEIVADLRGRVSLLEGATPT